MFSMEHGTKTTPAVETWRPIDCYEGLYEVSSLGRVRSLDRYIDAIDKYGNTLHLFFSSRILKQWHMLNGYVKVELHKDGKGKQYLVHRVVAQAFIPNPDNLPEINHKDRNIANNIVSNLEWCDRLYNIRYDGAVERAASTRRRTIEQLTMDGLHVAYHKGIRILCSEFPYDRRSIQRVLSNQDSRQSAYGYQWRYVNDNT